MKGGKKGGGKHHGYSSRQDGAQAAHLGPIPLRGGQGTLTARDKEQIYQPTGCSAAVRFRQQWGERCLTIMVLLSTFLKPDVWLIT